MKHYREDLVGEALEKLQDEHGIKREGIFLQTKYARKVCLRLITSSNLVRYTPISSQDSTLPLPYNPADPIKEASQVVFSNVSIKSSQRHTWTAIIFAHSPPNARTYCGSMACTDCSSGRGKVRKIGLSNVYDVGLLKSTGS